jgi:hypothetical protein
VVLVLVLELELVAGTRPPHPLPPTRAPRRRPLHPGQRCCRRNTLGSPGRTVCVVECNGGKNSAGSWIVTCQGIAKKKTTTKEQRLNKLPAPELFRCHSSRNQLSIKSRYFWLCVEYLTDLDRVGGHVEIKLFFELFVVLSFTLTNGLRP